MAIATESSQLMQGVFTFPETKTSEPEIVNRGITEKSFKSLMKDHKIIGFNAIRYPSGQVEVSFSAKEWIFGREEVRSYALSGDLAVRIFAIWENS